MEITNPLPRGMDFNCHSLTFCAVGYAKASQEPSRYDRSPDEDTPSVIAQIKKCSIKEKPKRAVSCAASNDFEAYLTGNSGYVKRELLSIHINYQQ
jgi:hypothetical protein